GPCAVGIESTVIDLTGERPALLRPGSVTPEMLEKVVGQVGFAAHDEAIKAPGMLKSHYAPSKKVRLNVTEPEEDEGYLAFGPKPAKGARVTLNLSESGDLAEAAANLFRHLRMLESQDITRISVAPLPESGIGEAINNRLAKASY
ncbi:MAG: translation factor Sua5, partial [Alphaproteobacteria bacterium]|nr:translation factor Sua5 [Alphaproteobacteria bacterium]